MQLLLFFMPICEFNITFISNFIGKNDAVYFLKICFTCSLLYKNYIFCSFLFLILLEK